MALPVSNRLQQLRGELWGTIQPFELWVEENLTTLEALKDNPIPQGKNPRLQRELEAAHAARREIFEKSILIIRMQYAIGLELKKISLRPDIQFEELRYATEMCASISTTLWSELQTFQPEMKRLEDRITVLN